jgi:hypothetical protein
MALCILSANNPDGANWILWNGPTTSAGLMHATNRVLANAMINVHTTSTLRRSSQLLRCILYTPQIMSSRAVDYVEHPLRCFCRLTLSKGIKKWREGKQGMTSPNYDCMSKLGQVFSLTRCERDSEGLREYAHISCA